MTERLNPQVAARFDDFCRELGRLESEAGVLDGETDDKRSPRLGAPNHEPPIRSLPNGGVSQHHSNWRRGTRGREESKCHSQEFSNCSSSGTFAIHVCKRGTMATLTVARICMSRLVISHILTACVFPCGGAVIFQ